MGGFLTKREKLSKQNCIHVHCIQSIGLVNEFDDGLRKHRSFIRKLSGAVTTPANTQERRTIQQLIALSKDVRAERKQIERKQLEAARLKS